MWGCVLSNWTSSSKLLLMEEPDQAAARLEEAEQLRVCILHAGNKDTKKKIAEAIRKPSNLDFASSPALTFAGTAQRGGGKLARKVHFMRLVLFSLARSAHIWDLC